MDILLISGSPRKNGNTNAWKNSLPVSSKPENIRSKQWMSPA